MASVAKLKELLDGVPDDYRARGTNSGNLEVFAEDGSRWAYLILHRDDDRATTRWYNRKKGA
jgi:hypothetical protein